MCQAVEDLLNVCENPRRKRDMKKNIRFISETKQLEKIFFFKLDFLQELCVTNMLSVRISQPTEKNFKMRKIRKRCFETKISTSLSLTTSVKTATETSN